MRATSKYFWHKRKQGKGFTLFPTSESRGFTLIELLVVIAIIGLLASIIIAALGTARQKGRDARRLADFQQVQTALELYYGSQNPSGYPPVNTWANLAAALAPTYMSAVPNDPSGGTATYTYQATKGDAAPTACGIAPCQGFMMGMQTEYTNYLTVTINGVGNVPTSACTPSGSSPYNYCVRK